MKTSRIFIITLSAMIFLSGFSLRGQSQLAQNFNASSDRNYYRNTCWYFASTSLSTNAAIDGISMRTGQLSGGNHFLVSPWIEFTGSGELAFDFKLDRNENNQRSLRVYLLSPDQEIDGFLESSEIVYSYDFNEGNDSQVVQVEQEISFSGFYRLAWVFSGSGGNTRGILDNISVFGTWAYDPTDNDGSGDCGLASSGSDTDEDGVADDQDDYPDDPFRAYRNPFNGDVWATIAFEDQWPNRGDYDFNDLVISYKMEAVTDAQNEMVELNVIVSTQAVGASFRNALGIMLQGVTPGQLIRTNNSLPGATDRGYFSLNENGTENGQTWAVVYAFDDAFKTLPHPGSGEQGVNTDPNGTYVQPEALTLQMVFKEDGETNGSEPVAIDDLPFSSVNMFLVVRVSEEGERREVHLPDYWPTDLASRSLFGTGDDDTQPGEKTYKTRTGLPWAIHILDHFEYPVEKVDITQAHLKFAEWAESGGTLFQDWYENKAGYREPENIYQK